MATLTQKYKQQAKQARVQTSENDFSKGMYFTKKPLSSGFLRTLVNMDIDETAGHLKTRKGLKLKEEMRTSYGSLVFENTAIPSTVEKYFDYSFESEQYKSLVYLHNNTNFAGGPEISLVKAFGKSNSVYTNIGSYQNLKVIDGSANERLALEEFKIGIHGKKLETIFNKKQLVSCLAFNNNLYTFKRGNTVGDPSLERELRYTKANKDIQPGELPNVVFDYPNADGFKTLKVVPQALNPTEAANWGMNMLLENPYQFECEQGAVVDILGMLPYTIDTDEAVLTPRQNETVNIKAYFSVPAEFHSNAENPITLDTLDLGAVTTLPLPKPDAYTVLGSYYQVPNGDYYMFYNGRWNNFGAVAPQPTEVITPNDSGEDYIRLKWEWKEVGSSSWNIQREKLIKLSEHYASNGNTWQPFEQEMQLPNKDTMIRLTIEDPQEITLDGAGNRIYTVLDQNVLNIRVMSEEMIDSLNIRPINYDLSTAKGMLEWSRRLVLWGVEDAENIIFLSDLDNPAYFPYPNNIDSFNEEVLNILNYGDELVAITRNNIYTLSWREDGAGWVKRTAQQNLNITMSDAQLAIVHRNMLFFKSGEYYYMMVPKSGSVEGTTTIAPISNGIKELLDDFHNNINKIINKQLGTEEVDYTEKLYDFSTYRSNNSVVVSYVYDLSDAPFETPYGNAKLYRDPAQWKFLNVELIYDTQMRNWKLRFFETAQPVTPKGNDSLKQTDYLSVVNTISYNATPGSTPTEPDMSGTEFNYVQFAMQAFEDSYEDMVIQNYSNAVSWAYLGGENAVVDYILRAVLNSTKLISNHAYIDSGNREINPDMKKRFREFQFRINNQSESSLDFANRVLIDGKERVEPLDYEMSVDENNVATMQRTLKSNMTLFSETTLNTPEYDDSQGFEPVLPEDPTYDESKDYWTLNYSAFPGRDNWKIRLPFSGKGYLPRIELTSLTEANYEILNMTFVFRTMNSR